MSGDTSIANLLETAARILDLARAKGAEEADLTAARSTDFEVNVAEGKIVTLSQATSKGVGLRIFLGGRMGFCTTSDFSPDSLDVAVSRAVAMAREAAVDPHNGLPEGLPANRIDSGADLDLYDPRIAAIDADEKIAWAHALEAAARKVDPRVKKFGDSGVGTNESESILVTSTGAVRTMRSSGIALWCNPIAEENGDLQTEFWFDSQTHLEDLESVESVGTRAAERAVRMLGAKPIKTQRVPVIFEPPMAAGLAAGMLQALDGDMVYKKASFLANKLDAVIANPLLTLIDDPLLPRGSGSTPFDGEGLPTFKKNLIDRGRLTTFLYDTYTARKAGVKPTANARRGVGGLPHAGVFNFMVQAGDSDPADIWRGVDRAFVMTRGLGSGVNPVTGEYSRGANGLWIERGEVIHPVQEVTIAGDYLSMLQNIDAVGSDLQMRGSSGAPTLRIAEMTVSGG